MKVKKLKTYLDKYPDNEEVRFIAADIKNRIAWASCQIGVIGITDEPVPVICLELHKSESFDAEMIQAAEEDEWNSMWIPVSERMPERGKTYLVSVAHQGSGVISVYDAILDSDGLWCRYNYKLIDKSRKVIAWMPLPEPYNDEQDN